MKKILIIMLALLMLFALAACGGGSRGGGASGGGTSAPAESADNEHNCPCDPSCTNKECKGGDKCQCGAGSDIGTISFIDATASSPNRMLPDYFIENYTLNFTAIKQGSSAALGSFTGTGYMKNEMDTSGAKEASGGRLIIDEMGWEGPFSDTSFELFKPEDIALTVDDDNVLALLTNPLSISNRSSMSWSVTGQHFAMGADGGGTADMAETYELTYHIVVYKNGTAELYLFDTTASDILCFLGNTR